MFDGRPVSNDGEAMGESSVVIVKRPSNGRSGNGAVTWAEILARTLCNSQLWCQVMRRIWLSIPRLA